MTAVFLVVLFADIVRKGLPAFTQHSLLLDVPVPADLVDAGQAGAIPSPSAAPTTFRARSRDALKAAHSRAREPRRRRRTLTRLLSSGAADALAQHVVADPA